MEQESGEVAQINQNPVLSRKDKLKRYQEIVSSSDRKMRSFLSNDQLQKLEGIRTEQSEQLGQFIRNGAPARRND